MMSIVWIVVFKQLTGLKLTRKLSTELPFSRNHSLVSSHKHVFSAVATPGHELCSFFFFFAMHVTLKTIAFSCVLPLQQRRRLHKSARSDRAQHSETWNSTQLIQTACGAPADEEIN